MSYVLFTVANTENLKCLAKFTHHMSKLEASSKTLGNTVPCISLVNGSLEQSFLSTRDDYVNHVLRYNSIGLTTILYTLFRNKENDSLRPLLAYDGTSGEYLGIFKGDKVMPCKKKGWTYRPGTKEYYSAQEE